MSIEYSAQSTNTEHIVQFPRKEDYAHIVQHPLKGAFDLSRAQWHRSGRIEIAFVDELIGMRDGADPDGPVLIFDQAEWDAFVAGAKDGEFDPPAA